jgi:hypothetical protein
VELGDPASHLANWLRHQALVNAFRRVAGELRDHHVPLLPVKGLVTAHLLYDDVAARFLSDVDLRVRRSDFPRVLDVARRAGWEPKTDMPVLGQVMWSIDGWEVDVESTLGPPGLCAISTDDVIARAESRTEPFGFPHLWPDFTDHALILVLNVFKDGLRSLPWSIEDLRRIALHPDFDAARLARRAAEGHVSSVLWIVADWLGEERGHAEWLAVRDRVGRRPRNRVAAALYARLHRSRTRSTKAELLVCAASGDGPRDVLRGTAFAVAGIVRRRTKRALEGLGHAGR